MKRPFPRLFLKIFLWFWSTMVISAIAVTLTVFLMHTRTFLGWSLRHLPANWHFRWLVGLSASALVCYLLTRYLTEPILRLRTASRRLAAGDLQARAEEMGGRRDELGDLVRDFNGMADRIEQLVSRQRALIMDVSHELRSPLARLNVALDLVRERKDSEGALEHMQQDVDLLNEMIERLLTIARLDTPAVPLPTSEVDMPELMAQIVHDAGFEARQRDVHVTFAAQGACVVRGNAELLSSAVENVVRNAVHYTEAGSTVEVRAWEECWPASTQTLISIRDHGPGVRVEELKDIFLPFYRTATARDRRSGGTGLGLAIAERVVLAHGGSIAAHLCEPHGLEFRIQLPSAEDNGQQKGSYAGTD